MNGKRHSRHIREQIMILRRQKVSYLKIAGLVGLRRSQVEGVIRNEEGRGWQKRQMLERAGARGQVMRSPVPVRVYADQQRRLALPDTLQNFFGDPKPGSGQSALEQAQK